MKKPSWRRLWSLLGIFAVFALGVGVILISLKSYVVYFVTPMEIDGHQCQTIRLGGLVKVESLVREGQHLTFMVTDGQRDILVSYSGIVPDLFREGQGVVAEGVYDGVTFHAVSILAKHDERYIPVEVAQKLKEMNQWKPS